MAKIKFDRLKDIAAIVAPASPFKDEKGFRDISLSMKELRGAISLFEKFSIKCKYDDKIFSGDNLEYFAATREERLRQFKEALEDPSVKIISALRGGYGSSEIVFDCLDLKPCGPKILIGFSDITVLHFLFNKHYGFPSIHGIVNEKYKYMTAKIVSILAGNKAQFTLKPLNGKAKEDVNIEGITTGGNLTLICNMIGTRLSPDNENKIIVIEDVAVRGYQVHRQLLHMYNAGLFKNAAALILGDFAQSDVFLEDTLNVFAENYLDRLPVFQTLNIGHCDENYPFALNALGIIKNKKLFIESPFESV